MLRYAVNRILWLIPVLLCISLIIYALMDFAPGTVIDRLITEESTEEDIIKLKAQYDLDKPMIYRYGKYMIGLFQGDLGTSQVTGLSVFGQYKERWPATLRLSLLSLLMGVVLAIPLGLFAAKFSGTILDNLTTAFSLIGLSMPGFWLGLLLLIWFSLKMKILPAGYDGTWKCYVLPVISSGLAMSATITRQTRSAILEESRQDYLRTARAKGVPEIQVTMNHKLRNAWIPIVTQIGLMLGITLSGSAITEQIFTWPGVGRLLVTAINQRDINMATGCVILTSAMFVIILLLVDIVYAFIDPRIRAKYGGGKKRKKAVVTS